MSPGPKEPVSEFWITQKSFAAWLSEPVSQVATRTPLFPLGRILREAKVLVRTSMPFRSTCSFWSLVQPYVAPGVSITGPGVGVTASTSTSALLHARGVRTCWQSLQDHTVSPYAYRSSRSDTGLTLCTIGLLEHPGIQRLSGSSACRGFMVLKKNHMYNANACTSHSIEQPKSGPDIEQEQRTYAGLHMK